MCVCLGEELQVTFVNACHGICSSINNGIDDDSATDLLLIIIMKFADSDGEEQSQYIIFTHGIQRRQLRMQRDASSMLGRGCNTWCNSEGGV